MIPDLEVVALTAKRLDADDEDDAVLLALSGFLPQDIAVRLRVDVAAVEASLAARVGRRPSTTATAPPVDDDVEGSWVRLTDEPEVRGVEVSVVKSDDRWRWQIGVFAAEFVREEPFEAVFRGRIDAAIRAVPGVSEVVEEDREFWTASGRADGRHSCGRSPRPSTRWPTRSVR